MIAHQFLINLLNDDDDDDDNLGHLLQQHQAIAAPNHGREPLNYLFLDDDQFRARFRAQKFVHHQMAFFQFEDFIYLFFLNTKSPFDICH